MADVPHAIFSSTNWSMRLHVLLVPADDGSGSRWDMVTTKVPGFNWEESFSLRGQHDALLEAG